MNFKYKKATQILNFFLTKAKQEKGRKTLYKTHLLKLLYLADRVHIRKYGTLVTNAEYQAWQYGQISPTAKNVIENIADKEDRSADVKYADAFISASRIPNDPSKIKLETKKEVDWAIIAKTEREKRWKALGGSTKIKALMR